MSVILNTCGISASILNIIDDATEYVVLISPFQKLDLEVRVSLILAMGRGVEVFVIDGKDGMNEEVFNWYTSFPNVSIGYVPELHAKVYANEKMAVVSSMNLHSFSQLNNEEMGVLFQVDKDKEEFENLSAHIFRLVNKAEEDFGPWNISKIYAWLPNRRLISREDGDYIHFCIRCGVMLPHWWNKVYCESCLISWKRNRDMNQIEYSGYCHSCGCECDPSPRKPLCYDCFLNDPDFAEGRVSIMSRIHELNSDE